MRRLSGTNRRKRRRKAALPLSWLCFLALSLTADGMVNALRVWGGNGRSRTAPNISTSSTRRRTTPLFLSHPPRSNATHRQSKIYPPKASLLLVPQTIQLDSTDAVVDDIISSADTSTRNERKEQPQLPLLFSIVGISSAFLLLMLLFVPHTGDAACWALDQVDQTVLGVPLPVPDVRYFIAGGCCAAASHGVTTPIDSVKTKIQASPAKFQGQSVTGAAALVLDEEGPGALLQGLGPTVVGYGLEGAAKFGLYETAKPIFASLTSTISLGYLGASVTAGAVASLLLCPLEQTRIRLVTDRNYAEGMVPAMTRMVQEEGWPQFLLGGCPAMLSKQIPYTFCKQVSFDVFAGQLYLFASSNFGLTPDSIKAEVSLGAAFLASILACIASHPGDVLLTDTYKKGERVTTTSSSPTSRLPRFTDVVSKLYAAEGIGGFFTGITARFFHVGAIITSQLVLYDFIKQLLGLPATGT